MIFLQPCGGLCNRLRAVAATKAFIRQYAMERRFILIWCSGDELNCNYNLLFEADEEICVKNYHSEGYNLKRLYWTARKMFMPHAENVDGVDKIERYIDGALRGKNLWIKTWHQFMPSPIDYGFFKPKKKYSAAADGIINGEDVIGLHIRRTDNSRSIQFSPLSLFFDKIDDEISKNFSVRFFVATDSPSDDGALRKRYGERIILRPEKELSRNSPRGIEDALIDVLCLSKCKKIYGSFWSSFSEVASYIGKKPLEILSIGRS